MSDPRGPAPLSVRLMSAAMSKAIELMQGYEPAFLEELLRTHGVRTFNRWAQVMGQVLDDLDARYGHADAQLIVAFAAFWRGCQYCSRGHLLAGNLARFRDEGELFPLHLDQVLELQRLDDDAILARVRELLAEHPRSRELLERQYQLLIGAEGEPRDDDPWLRASLATWDWLTDCSIMLADDVDVPPLSPIAKERDLLQRYRAARASQRDGGGSAPT